MKAIIQNKYGAPSEVLELREMQKPAPKDGEVLIKVQAASITIGDLAAVKGEPFIARLSLGFREPNIKTSGKDVAGIVEAVESNVKQFKTGDKVFGDLSECGWGAYAEYVSAPEAAIVHMPSNVSFEEAAALPESEVVALQGLQDKGQIQPGQKVWSYGLPGSGYKLISLSGCGIRNYSIYIEREKSS